MKECAICGEHAEFPVRRCSSSSKSVDVCADCWIGHVRARIESGEVTRVRCLCDTTCSRFLTSTEVEELLESESELLARFLRLFQQAQFAANPLTRWCPDPRCASPTLLESKPPRTTDSPIKVTCQACDRSYCASCQTQPFHAGNCTTKKHDDWPQTSEEVQQCPKCSTRIIKLEGCNHVACTTCGHEFCWLCRRPYTSDHYDWDNENGCASAQFRDRRKTQAEVRREIQERKASERAFFWRRVRSTLFSYLCLPLSMPACLCALCSMRSAFLYLNVYSTCGRVCRNLYKTVRVVECCESCADACCVDACCCQPCDNLLLQRSLARHL
ncbi:MAG: hypothetical protein MHM6MM_006552 [Cercozoa sp. M6MM]